MRRTVFAVVALALFLPLTTLAQQWNAEQQEVWEALETCWDAQEIDATMACIHDDYVAWNLDQRIPVTPADTRARAARWFETNEVVWQYRRPLSIDVRGNVAIVLYVDSYVSRNKLTGEETSGTINWTEVFEKDGNRWLLLTDHGIQPGRSASSTR